MTKKEFTDRTLVEVTDLEYMCIEGVYLNSDLNKDEFCKVWCKMNATRVEIAKNKKAEAEKREALRATLWGMVNNGYTFDEFESDAVYFFDTKELEALAKVGIEVYDYRYPKHEKSVMTICYEVSQYLNNNK